METDLRNAQSDEHDMPDQDEIDYQNKLLFDDGNFITSANPSEHIYLTKAIQDFEKLNNRNPFMFGQGQHQFELRHIDRHNCEHGSDIFELGKLYNARVEQIFKRLPQQTLTTPEYGC